MKLFCYNMVIVQALLARAESIYTSDFSDLIKYDNENQFTSLP